VGEWPRSYEAQVREAYLGNAVAQRSVRLVAESVAWAPLLAADGAAGGAKAPAGADTLWAGSLEFRARLLRAG
jgi:hypothetical protein